MGDRRLLIASTLVIAACGGGRYRTELVGHGDASVVARGTVAAPTDAVAAPGAGGIQLAQGSYELAMRFDLPRAQIVDWKLACPGVELDGAVGETFEHYRRRRLGELRVQRERERERMAAVTSTIIGAVAPSIEGRGRVRTPAGEVAVHAGAHVPAHAVGDAVAAGAYDEVVELPPGDVGRGSLAANVHVTTAADGVCVVQATADDADVRATFKVVRVRDLHAEARHREQAATSAAIEVRSRLASQLLSFGADATLRQRRLEAKAGREAQARAQARSKARVRATVEVEARSRARAMEARYHLLSWLAGECGAEPGRRQRLADEERVRREARLVAYAAIAQQRDQLALRARAELRAFLIALGAKERPPRPPPIVEEPGTAPFAGARWSDGYWSWTGLAWEWTAGGWSDPDLFGDAGDALYADFDFGDDLGDDLGSAGTRVRDHRGRTRDARIRDHREPRIRDHREPRIRDHRGSREPIVRDHRNRREEWGTPARSSSTSNSTRVRDHRDSKDNDNDDDKNDDPRPRVRDHRY